MARRSDPPLTDEYVTEFILTKLGMLLKSTIPPVRQSARIVRKLYDENARLKAALGTEEGKWTERVSK